MVATNSLVPLTADEKKTLRVAMSPAKYRKPTNHFVFEPSMESYYFPGDIEPHIKNSSVAKLFALFAQLEQAKQSNANLGVILPIESAISDTAQTARERILNASIRMRA
jgi:hypothetical protein